jgi:hypothetical protein
VQTLGGAMQEIQGNTWIFAVILFFTDKEGDVN